MPSRSRQYYSRSNPPDLQDTGFTINFKDKENGANKLASLAQQGPLTKQEALDLQRTLRKEKEKDAMSVDFHGMHLRFNRDHQPSSYGSLERIAAYDAPYDSLQYEREQGNIYDHYEYHHQHPLLYEMSYMLPLVIAAILSLCLMTIFYFTAIYISYQCSKFINRYRASKQYQFRGIPEETESEVSDV